MTKHICIGNATENCTEKAIWIRHTQYLNEVQNHFNEPMLSNHEVCRCIGYAETGIDCYIIAKFPYPKSKPQIKWLTMVGGYTWLDKLKGQGYVISNNNEYWDDLVRLDKSLTAAGCNEEEEFMIDIDHLEMEYMK